jgi:ferredoxin
MKSLRVNPIACEGHGLCAELLPERITLDDWGYPIVDPEPVSGDLESHARRAVAACPTLALLLGTAAAARPAAAAGRPVHARGRVERANEA